MDRKRSLIKKEIEYYTNLSDSELDEIISEGSNDSSNCLHSGNSSEDSDVEVVSEPEDRKPRGDGQSSFREIAPNIDDNLWTENRQNPEAFVFKENVGLKLDTANLTVETLVELFFSSEFVALIVEKTNRFAAQEFAKCKKMKKSTRLSKWTDVNPGEMKCFFGLLLQMGPCSFPSIEHYWSRKKMYNITFWRTRMSRNRFQLLLRCLHFVDNSIQSSDRLYKVRPIIDHFNNVMRQNYVPNKDLCIGESTMLWHGRLYFRQCIKNEKHECGVKLYELRESDGVVMKIKVYSGKYDEIENNWGHATDVVLYLLEDYLDRGYTVYLDGFYNSVALAKFLTKRKTYVCGMLRIDRQGNPGDVVNRQLKKGEFICQQSGPVTVCKWKDKRDILAISNMHVVEIVQVANRSGKLSVKPNIIRDYNAGMSGIDRSDQMLSHYTSLRKTIGWHNKVALYILETYINNSHKLFVKATRSQMNLIKFRDAFVDALVGDGLEPVAKKCKPQDLHYLRSIPPTENKLHPTKPCRVCRKEKIRRETRYFCPVCEEQPPLCVENCFKNYHLQKYYSA